MNNYLYRDNGEKLIVMNIEQAKEYAKTMTYSQALRNLWYAKGISYKKATLIKLKELAKIADELDRENNILSKGKWKWKFADNGWKDIYCSECGWTKNVDVHVSLNYNFCPGCGAKMR